MNLRMRHSDDKMSPLPQPPMKAFRSLSVAIASASLLSACSTVTVPERFASAVEAYGTSDSYSVPANRSQDSYSRVVLGASKEDVMRALDVTLAEKDMNVESRDNSLGSILASKASDSASHLYAFKIGRAAGGTELEIFAKVQLRCWKWSGSSVFLYSVGTFGLLTYTLLDQNSTCDAQSKVRWPDGYESQQATMNDIIGSVKTKLYATGAM